MKRMRRIRELAPWWPKFKFYLRYLKRLRLERIRHRLRLLREQAELDPPVWNVPHCKTQYDPEGRHRRWKLKLEDTAPSWENNVKLLEDDGWQLAYQADELDYHLPMGQ